MNCFDKSFFFFLFHQFFATNKRRRVNTVNRLYVKREYISVREYYFFCINIYSEIITFSLNNEFNRFTFSSKCKNRASSIKYIFVFLYRIVFKYLEICCPDRRMQPFMGCGYRACRRECRLSHENIDLRSCHRSFAP